MLKLHYISFAYDLNPILIDINFSLAKHQRIGLIGPNGCGKSTLLQIISGKRKPDSGTVQITPKNLTIGYLPQGFMDVHDLSIEQYLSLDIEYLNPDVDEKFTQLSEQIVLQSQNRDLQEKFNKYLHLISLKDSYRLRLTSLIKTLNLQFITPSQPFDTLSGGQKTRLGLLKILLLSPDILLLDEPTNHLDFSMLIWLEKWLNQFEGGALVVSHDRVFLDRITTDILELDPRTHNSRLYPGNYTNYIQKKEEEKKRNYQEYADQQSELARLGNTVSHLRGLAKLKKGGKADSGDKFAKGFFANRSSATVGRAKQIHKRIEKILSEEKIEKPPLDWEMKIEFEEEAQKRKIILELNKVSIGYPEKTLLKNLNLTIQFGQHVVLVGANGSGKTSMIRTILEQIPPLEGCIRFGTNVKPGYMSQDQDTLNPDLNALETISSVMIGSETDIRSFLSKLLFKGDDVFLKVKNMSYGERSRLSLAVLIAQGCNFLILDEPINHLDISARNQFEQALSGYKGTILSVVHDRYYITKLASEVWKIKQNTIQRFEQTDIYGTEGIFELD